MHKLYCQNKCQQNGNIIIYDKSIVWIKHIFKYNNHVINNLIIEYTMILYNTIIRFCSFQIYWLIYENLYKEINRFKII